MGDDVRLERGIQLAREGRRQEAYQLLSEYVKYNPQHEQAWLWLSGVVDKPEHTRACLERVLAINPNNTQAKQGLEWLVAKQAATSASTPVTPPQAVEPPKPTSRPIYDVLDPLAPTSSTSNWSLKSEPVQSAPTSNWSLTSEPTPPTTTSSDNYTNRLETVQAARESAPQNRSANEFSLSSASMSSAISGSGVLDTSSAWPAKQEQAVVSNQSTTVQTPLHADAPHYMTWV